MELKYFRLIKTIAEEGSIANSSERLFLTQSALSHQLREVEERLGFKVFQRKRNQWKLTQEGEEIYALANQLFDSIEKGFSKIKQIKEGSKGQIKISVECQSFFQQLPGFIQKMGILYPEIEIELDTGPRNEMISKVQANQIDLCLATFKPEAEDLLCLEVFRDEIFGVVNKEHFFNEEDYVAPGKFADCHLIINSFPLEGVAVYEHALRHQSIHPKKISAIPFTEISLAMAAANIGVLCAPKWQLNCFKLQEELTFKRIGLHGLKRTHYLIIKKAALQKKYISNFVETFEEEFIGKL
ncbi:MAG: LysR family transcriptional regulator [Bacteroidia bacterium]|nr:LysR family transcriptional regulator [Bacteroidia bacterium]